MRDMNHQAIKTIDALGGTAQVSRLFDVRMASVSDWKKTGIPKARVMYLKAAHAKALAHIDLEAATALSSRAPAAIKPEVEVAHV